jgi:cell division protein FtsB
MQQSEQTEKKRKRTGQLSGVQVMFAAILAIGLALAINLSSLINSARPLQEKYRQLSGEITQLDHDQASLLVERDYARSDAYVESWARDEGKMVKPGEVLIVPVPSGIDVQPTVVPEPGVTVETTPPEPQPWMLWWALFFDNPPPNIGGQ